MIHLRAARLLTRRGITLAEACIAIALTGLIAVWATRLVFLSDRAIQEDTRQIHHAVARMSLEAMLRDDIQIAKEAAVTASGALHLAYADGSSLTYSSSQEGTTRVPGAGEPDLFAGVRTTFQTTEQKLVKTTLVDAAGEQTQITLLPRNAIDECGRHPWAQYPMGDDPGGGGGDE